MSHIYVIEFDHGQIKVGRSNDPSIRYEQQCDRAAEDGAKPVRWASDRCVGDVVESERRLIAYAAANAAGQIRREWFLGLSYAAVVGEMLRIASENVQPTPVDFGQRELSRALSKNVRQAYENSDCESVRAWCLRLGLHDVKPIWRAMSGEHDTRLSTVEDIARRLGVDPLSLLKQ